MIKNGNKNNIGELEMKTLTFCKSNWINDVEGVVEVNYDTLEFKWEGYEFKLMLPSDSGSWGYIVSTDGTWDEGVPICKFLKGKKKWTAYVVNISREDENLYTAIGQLLYNII